jgi:hypothetical protein
MIRNMKFRIYQGSAFLAVAAMVFKAAGAGHKF